MNIEVKTIGSLLKDSILVLDDEIQRSFTWPTEKVENACRKIYESAIDYFANRKLADSRSNFGSIYCYGVPSNDIKNKFEFVKMDNNTYAWYYIDDGGHRILITLLTLKALCEIIDEFNNCTCYDEPIIDQYTLIELTRCNEAIKTQFIPRTEDRNVFNFIIQNKEEQVLSANDKKLDLYSAYNLIKDFFTQVLEDNCNEFKLICKFVTEYLNFTVHTCPETTSNIRLKNYNDINNIAQPQGDCHRLVSTLKDIALKNGYHNFTDEIEQSKKLLTNKGFEKTVDSKIFLYIKTQIMKYYGLNTIPKTSAKWHDSIKHLLETDPNSVNFFTELFNDFNLYVALLAKNLKCSIPHTKNCGKLYFSLGCCTEIFANGEPRETLAAFYLSLLSKLFVIDNNTIKAFKQDVHKKKVNDLLSLLSIYHICVWARGTDVTDERMPFKPMLRSPLTFNEEQLDILIEHFHKTCTECTSTDLFQHIGLNSTIYKRKGVFLLAGLVSFDDEEMDKLLFNVGKGCFERHLWDIDHIYQQVLEIIHYLYNLRWLLKGDNRADNTLVYTADGTPGRFIQSNDNTVPIDLQGRVFTKTELNLRKEWTVKRLHSVVEYLLEL